MRRGPFGDTVELARDGGSDRIVYHAPPVVVLQPGTTLAPHLYDERLILDALDRRGPPRSIARGVPAGDWQMTAKP